MVGAHGGARRCYEPTDLSSANMLHTNHSVNQQCSVAVVLNTEVYTFTQLYRLIEAVSGSCIPVVPDFVLDSPRLGFY